MDYRMIFRIMLEEALSYLKQQKDVYKKWTEAGYKFNSDEFLSRMPKGGKIHTGNYVSIVSGKREKMGWSEKLI